MTVMEASGTHSQMQLRVVSSRSSATLASPSPVERIPDYWVRWGYDGMPHPNIYESDDEPQIVLPTLNTTVPTNTIPLTNTTTPSNTTAPSNSTSEDLDPDPVPREVGPYRLRVEGRTTTLFEAFLDPAPSRNVTTASGGTHNCHQLANRDNPDAGASLTSLLVDANLTFDGTYNNDFQDFTITMIGGDAFETGDHWASLRDQSFTASGDCQEPIIPNTDNLWAYGAFGSTKVLCLDMTGPTVAAVNTTITVNVRGTNPQNGTSTPLGGATLKDGEGNVLGISDASGDVPVVMSKRGIWKLKAEKDGTIRSNGLTVYVLRPTNPYLNGTSNGA